MIQRIVTAAVLIPLVLLLILRAPWPVLTLAAAVVAMLAIREFLALMPHYGVDPFSTATYVYSGIFFLAVGGMASSLVPAFFAALSPFVFLAVGMRRGSLSSIYPSAAASAFAFLYVAVPMKMLLQLRPELLIYLMIVVWSGDIFAYFIGKYFGRYKMAARISPKKTWEGAVASWMASVGFGTLFLTHVIPVGAWLVRVHLLETGSDWSEPSRWWPLWGMILVSTVLNFAAQLGDLVESAIKRGADVKDSGSILPGHGGMLDRIDALLFAAPVLWWISLAANFAFGIKAGNYILMP